MRDIGQLIKKRRLELGLTQEELALKVGYKTKSSINKIELERDVPIKKLKPIAEALDLDIKVLLGWDVAERSEENAEALANLMNDAKLLDYVKKIQALDETKKEAMYSYIDFLASN